MGMSSTPRGAGEAAGTTGIRARAQRLVGVMPGALPDPAEVPLTPSTRPEAGVEAVVDDALSRILRTLTREKVRIMRTSPGEGGTLSPTDLWLLGYLHEHDGVRLGDLAVWQDVDKSTMTMQVKRLVAAGLAERTSDERDRRAARIRLTDLGVEVLTLNRERAHVFVAALIDGWTETERDELARSLVRLAEAVEGTLAESVPQERPECLGGGT